MVLTPLRPPRLPNTNPPDDDDSLIERIKKVLRSLRIWDDRTDNLDTGIQKFDKLTQDNPDEVLNGLRTLGRTPETESFLKVLKSDIGEDDFNTLFPFRLEQPTGILPVSERVTGLTPPPPQPIPEEEPEGDNELLRLMRRPRLMRPPTQGITSIQQFPSVTATTKAGKPFTLQPIEQEIAIMTPAEKVRYTTNPQQWYQERERWQAIRPVQMAIKEVVAANLGLTPEAMDNMSEADQMKYYGNLAAWILPVPEIKPALGFIWRGAEKIAPVVTKALEQAGNKLAQTEAIQAIKRILQTPIGQKLLSEEGGIKIPSGGAPKELPADVIQKFLATPDEQILRLPDEVVDTLKAKGFTDDYIRTKMSLTEAKGALSEVAPVPEVTIQSVTAKITRGEQLTLEEEQFRINNPQQIEDLLEWTKKFAPEGIPTAEPGMPEAGLQPEMFGAAPTEVRPAGKGRSKFTPSPETLQAPARPAEAVIGKIPPAKAIPPVGAGAIPPTGGKVPPAGAGGAKVPPKSPLGTIESMWETGRKPAGKNMPDAYLKAQEYGNDIYYGIRTMQSRVAKNLPIVAGGPNDITTLLTRAPGAANAGATRYILAINEIKRMAPKATADDINSILYANHAKEVLAAKGPGRVMAGGFKTSRELDDALAQLQAKLGAADYGQPEAAAEYIKGIYANELDNLVQEGLISKELGKELSQKYPWYNPLHYVDEAEEMAAKGKSVRPFNVISSGLRRLSEKGTAKESIAPLNLLGDQLIRNEVRIVKNQTAKAIINVAKEDQTLVIKKITGIRPVAQIEGKGVFRPTTQDIPGTLSFFENGKRQIYKVPDFIYREANVLNQTISNPVSSLIGAMNGISRAAFTTASPPFVVSNILNDMLTAFINRGILPTETGARLIKSLGGLENDKIMQAFRLAGGYQQRFYGRSAQQLAKEVGVTGGKIIRDNKSFLQKVWQAIPAAGEAGEQAPRTALFRRQLSSTLPEWKTMAAEEIAVTPQGRKAAAEAVELTINFGRGGYLVKAANPFVIFLNASMEGTKLPFRVLRDNPAARWRLAGVAAGTAGIAAYNLSYPEYMDIPNYIRWGSFVVMLPSKEKNPDGTNKPNYTTIIPRTREWGAFLGSLTYGLERMYAENPADFGTFSTTMAPMLSPISEIPVPQVIGELLQQQANWDLYRSRPIVSQSLQNLPVAEQTTPSVSRTAELGARAVGVSPVRAQHFLSGIFGGTFQTITSVTDWVANLLAPDEVEPRIETLALQYQNLPINKMTPSTITQEDFLKRMNASDKRAMLNYLEGQHYQTVPVLGAIARRVMPGYGGQLESNQYELEESVSMLPSYWRDTMTPEQMKQVDVKYWTDKKAEDAKLIEQYNLGMIGKSDAERETYRIKIPTVDVALNFWGQISSVKSLVAAKSLKALAQRYGIPLTTIPAFGKTESGKEKLPPEPLWPNFFGYFAIQYTGTEGEKKQTKEREAFRRAHPEFEKWGQANLGWKPLTTTSSSTSTKTTSRQITK